MKKYYYIMFFAVNTIFSISAMEIDCSDLSLDKKLVEFICSNKSIDEIEYLLKAGANVNIQDEYGFTPLFSAATRGYIDIVKMLVEYGANINATNECGQVLLYNSNVLENKKIMEIFIEHGMNINAKDCSGRTPLHYAALNSDIEAARCFIEKDADIKALDCEYCSPLHFFCNKSLIDFKDQKGVELLTTVPMIFKNIKNVDLSKNKNLLKKLDIFTLSSTDKIFEWVKAWPTEYIEVLVGLVFPLNNAIQSKYVERFTLKCYMNSDKNLSQLFITELYKQHLLELKSYISIKNKVQVPALNLARMNNQNNIVTYLSKIHKAQKYDDLDKGLRDIIEENYKDRLAPQDYFTNKETALGMPLMSLK